MKKWLENFLFKRRLAKTNRDFIRLMASVEKLELPRFKKRQIYKGLLKAAGFVGIRIREKKDNH